MSEIYNNNQSTSREYADESGIMHLDQAEQDAYKSMSIDQLQTELASIVATKPMVAGALLDEIILREKVVEHILNQRNVQMQTRTAVKYIQERLNGENKLSKAEPHRLEEATASERGSDDLLAKIDIESVPENLRHIFQADTQSPTTEAAPAGSGDYPDFFNGHDAQPGKKNILTRYKNMSKGGKVATMGVAGVTILAGGGAAFNDDARNIAIDAAASLPFIGQGNASNLPSEGEIVLGECFDENGHGDALATSTANIESDIVWSVETVKDGVQKLPPAFLGADEEAPRHPRAYLPEATIDYTVCLPGEVATTAIEINGNTININLGEVALQAAVHSSAADGKKPYAEALSLKAKDGVTTEEAVQALNQATRDQKNIDTAIGVAKSHAVNVLQTAHGPHMEEVEATLKDKLRESVMQQVEAAAPDEEVTVNLEGDFAPVQAVGVDPAAAKSDKFSIENVRIADLKVKKPQAES